MGMPPVPSGHMGAATTGQPANEMGWVSRPMDGPTGQLLAVDVQPLGADDGRATGVAGREQHVPVLKQRVDLVAVRRRKRWARRYQAAGCSAPAMKRSTDSGSKSVGARAQVVQVQRAALAGAGDEGRCARGVPRRATSRLQSRGAQQRRPRNKPGAGAVALSWK
jgi:hypothetical protein